MTNRVFKGVVITQVCLIAFLLLFILNAEIVLELLRTNDTDNLSAQQQDRQSAGFVRESFFEVMDVRAAGLEAGVAHQLFMQRDIGFDAFDDDLGQGNAHTGHRRLTGITVSDDFADH